MPGSVRSAASPPFRSDSADAGAARTDAPPPAAALVAGWPGPALLVTADGGLTAASPAGRTLVEADGPDAPWRRALFAWLDGSGPAADPAPAAALSGHAAGAPAATAGDPGDRSTRHVSEVPRGPAAILIEWTAIALPDNTVALLGRDVTLERAIHGALVESRQRLRALIDMAGDLAFEVDATGRFVFLTPDRVLGRPADALIGREPQALLADADVARSPFETRRPVVAAPVVLADASGRRVPGRVTAGPVAGRDGAWAGARGLVRFERPKPADGVSMHGRGETADDGTDDGAPDGTVAAAAATDGTVAAAAATEGRAPP